MGQSIPLVCEDWANTYAGYRFFANDRVSDPDILVGHFQRHVIVSPHLKFLVLVLHDATEFSYHHESSEARRDKAGGLRSHAVSAILMHSSLAVTTEALPLGLAAVKFWTRKNFRGMAALTRRSIRPGFPSRKRKAPGGRKISSSLAALGSSGSTHASRCSRE
ncbi:hypothetical protein FXB41_32475 [Bradyrhizobium canariense]|nr:hypothetical protein [Bradyrhizobium canariense]